MRYLAIDHGDRRTGLAVCDATQTIVSPLTVLATDGALVDRIAAVVAEEGIQAIVVGLPLNMDDTEGHQAKKVRRFAAALAERLRLPIHFQDERLTSFDAADRLTPLSLTRKRKKKRLDAVAAAAILEQFLTEHPRPDSPPTRGPSPDSGLPPTT